MKFIFENLSVMSFLWQKFFLFIYYAHFYLLWLEIFYRKMSSAIRSVYFSISQLLFLLFAQKCYCINSNFELFSVTHFVIFKKDCQKKMKHFAVTASNFYHLICNIVFRAKLLKWISNQYLYFQKQYFQL